MELRFFVPRAYRASKSGLGSRTHEAAGPGRSGVHPIAAGSGGAGESDVLNAANNPSMHRRTWIGAASSVWRRPEAAVTSAYVRSTPRIPDRPLMPVAG